MDDYFCNIVILNINYPPVGIKLNTAYVENKEVVVLIKKWKNLDCNSKFKIKNATIINNTIAA